MASAPSNGEDRTEEAHEPRECMPCRGSGELISNLGGEPSKVACPWCEGSGVRIAGIDAQAHWGAGSGVDATQGDDAGDPAERVESPQAD